MKIVCVANDPVIKNYLQPLNKFGELDVRLKGNLSKDEAIEIVKNAEILITGPESIENLSEEFLKQLSNLKYIALLTISYNWVDITYANKINLPISNIKGSTAESVAEHTWAMILDLSKRVNEFDRETRLKGAFNFSFYKGHEVYGKTLGVLGLGDIGQKVARIARAFDMKVLGLNASGKSYDGVNLVDKSTLLKESDIIAVCLPLNLDTENFINKEEVLQMKDGVIIVNCAREKLVNKEAIIAGLINKKIFGYGVETAILKPVDKNDDYYKFPNVIVTPHNAFNTVEGDKRSYELVIENIKSFLNGKPQNLITNH